MGVGGQLHAPAALPPEKTRYPLHIQYHTESIYCVLLTSLSYVVTDILDHISKGIASNYEMVIYLFIYPFIHSCFIY
jgi:hypothetical protein